MHRREGQLHALATVHFASPKSALRKCGVDHPFPVRREVHAYGVNPGNVRQELVRGRIVLRQLTSNLGCDHKYSLAIRAYEGRGGGRGTSRQLYRLLANLAKETRLFSNRPDVVDSAAP